MIRAIAVDDELPALNRVGKMLESLEGIRLDGLFDKAQAFLEHALTAAEPIDLVLLDLEMPVLHGLELARRLREFRPETHIAFLTAHEEYAREAFEVEALDYLLKPVMKDDLERMVGRYEKRTGKARPNEEPPRGGVSIHSFGPFSVTTEQGEQVRFRNSKSRELLAYLHRHGGRAVGKVQIMNELWHGRDADSTQANLHTTVYQLRKDLESFGLSDVVEQSKTAGGSYAAKWSAIAYDDVEEYGKYYRLYKKTSSITHAIVAIRLYEEGYLNGSGYDWAAPRQAELEIGYVELLEATVDTYAKQQRYELALNPMQKWVQLVPFGARLHSKMIALLVLLGREDDARSYRELALDLVDPDEEGAVPDFESLSANPASLFQGG
ncbi:response regulator [Cohnella suwonensis]|uniref:Response regulator n=1 Tax=Cohnella suwonensis TaxID=696072 RepID=A0ABW0LTC3_9BACL